MTSLHRGAGHAQVGPIAGANRSKTKKVPLTMDRSSYRMYAAPHPTTRTSADAAPLMSLRTRIKAPSLMPSSNSRSLLSQAMHSTNLPQMNTKRGRVIDHWSRVERSAPSVRLATHGRLARSALLPPQQTIRLTVRLLLDIVSENSDAITAASNGHAVRWT